MSKKHYPSCNLNDLDLMWVCSQCGNIEPAEDEILGVHQKELQEARAEIEKLTVTGKEVADEFWKQRVELDDALALLDEAEKALENSNGNLQFCLTNLDCSNVIGRVNKIMWKNAETADDIISKIKSWRERKLTGIR